MKNLTQFVTILFVFLMKGQNTSKHAFSIGLFLVALLCALPLAIAAQENIVFVSRPNSSTPTQVFVMNPDGSGRTQLTSSSSGNSSPVFSPDGSKIAFTRVEGVAKIYVMNSDGSNQMPLTDNSAENRNPSFSPDGSKIVFTSNRDSILQIYMMNTDGTDQIRLANAAVEDQPSFGPDGRIAFISTGNLSNTIGDIYVMNADGSNRTRLTTFGDDNFAPRFSPDGSKIVFTNYRDANFDIYIMNSDGSNQTRLTNSPQSDVLPSFSPDGSEIAFRSNRDGAFDIFVMNVDGTNPIRITDNISYNDAPFWWGIPENTPPTITALGATVANDSNTPNLPIATVNDAEDALEILAVTINGNPLGTTVNGVTVAGIAVSSTGNVTANVAATCGATDANFTLRVTDGGSLFSEATLNVSVTPETIAPTLILPSNIVTALPLNSTDTGKIVNFTVSATDNCDANPTVAAVPPSGSAFPIGTTTVNVTGTDASGNTATGSFTVTVQYNFAGFFQPIDNLPTVNVVSAGQSVPVKFSLSGYQGLNIFAAGYPSSQQITCTSGAPVSPVDETITAGSSNLSYDAATDRYMYVWKTEKAWKGTCRQLIVMLADGTLHVANFQFK